ncbi:MAG: hypothetical protein Q9M91_00240 [Candidatus Dojkabacteria bacterium]|nr:hypothetical protein [Candidatus Dojkabacteria bacterium]MDQ7020261.1 hypothetical protein [Candidatus Dojkabacteria bacterium]
MKDEFKVFFTCAKSGREKHIDDFRTVLKAIEKHKEVKLYTPEGGDTAGYRLTNGVNYLEVYKKRRKNIIKNIDDLKYDSTENKYVHHDAIRMCIMIADAVIIDGTHPSFRLGYEATIATQHKKPTLVVSKTKDYSDLINAPYLYGAIYTKYTISEIVTNFLNEAKKKALRHRFNLMISDEEKEYLDQKSLFEGVSKAEYIRNLVRNDLNK